MKKVMTKPIKIKIEIKLIDIEDRSDPLTQEDFIEWSKSILYEKLEEMWIDYIQSGIEMEKKVEIEELIKKL